MNSAEGFLDDTSLLKTPRSPLKTSTVMKPSANSKGNRFSKRNTADNMDSVFFLPEDSFQALHEVTNIPNFTPKVKFDGSVDSSLGILHMENFSDFTDNSMTLLTDKRKSKVKTKGKGSKSFSMRIQRTDTSKIKENQSINSTSIGAQSIGENAYDGGEESSSSSDIEYDGTNIPELNLEYNPFLTSLAAGASTSRQMLSGNKIPANETVLSITKKCEADSSGDKTKIPEISFTEAESETAQRSSQAEDFKMPRDSIFKNFEPAYDSIFNTMMTNDSVSEGDKTSKLCQFLDIDFSLTESILQNQTLAEQKFLEGVENLNSNRNLSLKFCENEISARSSSFRSPSNSLKSTTDSAYVSDKEKVHIGQNPFATSEDFKDEVLGGSFFLAGGSHFSSKSEGSFTKCKVTSSADSTKYINADSFSNTGQNLSYQNSANVEEFECELNFKNVSEFCTADKNGTNQLEVSDSEFISCNDALKLFEQDEENLKQEAKFQIGNDVAKESLASNWSPPTQHDITAPSWYLEMNNSLSDQEKRHISIGTLISARTENLGRLSEDSKRERPFFGTSVSTPSRGKSENTTILSDTSEVDFEASASGENERALKSALFQNNSESELLRESTLSRILNDASTTQPLELAMKIFDQCQKNKIASKREKSSHIHKSKSTENIYIDSKKCPERLSNICDGINAEDNIITRSPSMDSITTMQEAKDTSLPNGLSVSHLQSNHQKMGENAGNGYSNCCNHQQKMASSRPQSSCSSSCTMSLHNQFGGLKFFGLPGDQNLYASQNSLPQLGNCCQCPNSHIHNVLTSQGAALAIPQLFQPPQVQVTMWPTVPAQGSFPVVQGPMELVFPEKISVGDSQRIILTVQNSPNHAMHYFYHVSYISAVISGEPISLEISGVSFPNMVPRSSGSTTDIQITLSPRYEGKILVTLQIVACFNPADLTLGSVPNSALKTTIQYEALVPSISISSNGKDSLDIGSIIAESIVKEKITITNKCDAAVPLCISLSRDIKDNRISFDLNQMKRQKYPASCGWKMISRKAMNYRLPCFKDESVPSTFEVPIVFESGKDDCTVNFDLTASLATVTSEPLAFFRISALVGIAKLILTDPSQNPLLLRASANSVTKRTITVKNHASFPVVYDLIIIDDETQSFSVSPTSLDMQPMQTSEVSISYSSSTLQVVKGCLQAAAQPHGKVFMLAEIIGDGRSSSASTDSIPRNSGQMIVEQPNRACKSEVNDVNNIISCNKRYLFWDGVDVGNTENKTFKIRNCLNKSLKAKFFIKQNIKTFKFLDDKNEQAVTLTLGLEAREEKCVSVVFSPTDIMSYSGFLVIKPVLEKEQKVFSIPLIGYGGAGKLQVTGLSSKDGIGNCLDIHVIPEMKQAFSNITINNTGTRAMFVKALNPFEGSSDNSKDHVIINPTEFVLLPNENKNLSISYSSPQGFYHYNTANLRVITLMYGDEIVRQQIQRNENFVLHGVNFDAHFEGEERVPYDSLFQRTSKFYSLFAATLKKFLIPLNVIEQNINASQMSFYALSMLHDTCADFTADSTLLCRRLTTPISHSPPVKEYSIDPSLHRLSMPQKLDFSQDISVSQKAEETKIKANFMSWVVKPEILVIDAPNKDNRLLLISLSKQDLRFRVECTIDVISVSPVRGIIGAKGHIGLRITVIPYSYSKLMGDYEGNIKIICDGVEKIAVIKVLKDQKRCKEIVQPNDPSVQLEDITKLEASEDKTIIPFVHNICHFPKEISLNPAVTEKLSETVITIQNKENCSVQWDIRPISMIFSEEAASSSADILQVSPNYGQLLPAQIADIVITFIPPRADSYYCIYELTLTFVNKLKQKSNFKVTAKGYSGLTESDEFSKSSISLAKEIKTHLFPRKKSKASILVETGTCEFPATSLGQSNVAYVTVKNVSLQDIKLNIIKPRPPFYVKQTSVVIRSKKFSKIPVLFKPVKSEEIYEETMEFHSEDGNEFLIKLIGSHN